jgi:integrase
MSAAVAVAPQTGESLAEALGTFLKAANCADATRIAHAENARALLRYFGERPVSDFGGRRGARLAAAFLRNETSNRRRAPAGGRRGPLGYGAVRARLSTLRKALDFALERGALPRPPEGWPIPKPGSEGHLEARTRYILRDEAELIRERFPTRRRQPPAVSRCSIPASAPVPSGVTLGEALGWLTGGGGVRRRTDATQRMRAEHATHVLRFWGADRPIGDFVGANGYALLRDFVRQEGPEEGGRGVRFCTIRKRLNTLSLALKEGVKRGALAALPPFPELPADSVPRERWLTFDEYERLRGALRSRWRPWLDLGVFTGQHSSDLDTMTFGMLDLGAGPGAGPGSGAAFFLRRNTKNKRRPAWLPMPDELRRRLTDLWTADRRTGAPPPHPDECIVGRWHAAGRTLRKACFKLGIEPVAPIDLRRTCATWWIDAGGPKEGLRLFLGHAANSSMVERHYSKVTPLMTAEGVAALDRQAHRGRAPSASASSVALLPAAPAATEVG